MSVRLGAVLLHTSAIAIMTYGYRCLGSLMIDNWVRGQKGGHFQFLTIQGLAVAWLTMVVGIAVDLFPFRNLRKIKRALLMVSVPLAVVISSIYWTLLFLFPTLILQSDPSTSVMSSSSDIPNVFRIPLSVDLALHASPVSALLIDFLLLERKYTRKETTYGAPFAVLLSTTWYAWWVENCASFNGTFPYPFLTDNPFEIRVGIYMGAGILALFSFWTINAWHPKR